MKVLLGYHCRAMMAWRGVTCRQIRAAIRAAKPVRSPQRDDVLIFQAEVPGEAEFPLRVVALRLTNTVIIQTVIWKGKSDPKGPKPIHPPKGFPTVL